MAYNSRGIYSWMEDNQAPDPNKMTSYEDTLKRRMDSRQYATQNYGQPIAAGAPAAPAVDAAAPSAAAAGSSALGAAGITAGAGFLTEYMKMMAAREAERRKAAADAARQNQEIIGGHVQGQQNSLQQLMSAYRGALL